MHAAVGERERGGGGGGGVGGGASTSPQAAPPRAASFRVWCVGEVLVFCKKRVRALHWHAFFCCRFVSSCCPVRAPMLRADARHVPASLCVYHDAITFSHSAIPLLQFCPSQFEQPPPHSIQLYQILS
jgi:hypothetical protein